MVIYELMVSSPELVRPAPEDLVRFNVRFGWLRKLRLEALLRKAGARRIMIERSWIAARQPYTDISTSGLSAEAVLSAVRKSAR